MRTDALFKRVSDLVINQYVLSTSRKKVMDVIIPLILDKLMFSSFCPHASNIRIRNLWKATVPSIKLVPWVLNPFLNNYILFHQQLNLLEVSPDNKTLFIVQNNTIFVFNINNIRNNEVLRHISTIQPSNRAVFTQLSDNYF